MGRYPSSPEVEFPVHSRTGRPASQAHCPRDPHCQHPRPAHAGSHCRGLQTRPRSTLPGMSFFFVFPLFFPEPIEFQGSSYGDNYDPEDPLNNVKVREALNIAIDREEIREVFLGDRAFLQGRPRHDAHPPRLRSSMDSLPLRPGTREGASRRGGLSRRPYNRRRSCTQYVGASRRAPDITEATLPYWNAIGVKTNFTTLDYGLVISNTQTYQYGRTLVGYRFGVGPRLHLRHLEATACSPASPSGRTRSSLNTTRSTSRQ